jgi:hypothetical protein
MLREIGDPKIRILPTQWSERIRSDYSLKGFIYGQQKSIALFNCTGDWAFYLEGDEVVYEDDLPKIRRAMEHHLDDERVEALAFNYHPQRAGIRPAVPQSRPRPPSLPSRTRVLLQTHRPVHLSGPASQQD